MNRRGFILGLGVIAALTGFAVSPAVADGERVALVISNEHLPERADACPIQLMTLLMSPGR